jgi:protein translocase SecG subunit
MNIISNAEIILKYIAAVAAVLLIVIILLQVRSGGLGSTFGGSSGGGEGYRSKRGIEALLYNSTIVLIAVFAVSAFVLAAIGI